MIFRRLNRLWQDTRAVVAVEFALLAPLVLIIVFAALELALMFVAQNILDKTAADTARIIRTNQMTAQNPQDLEDEIRRMACEDVALMDCQNLLEVHVLAFQNMADIYTPESTDAQVVEASLPHEFVVLRLFYPWQFTLPTLGYFYNAMDQRWDSLGRNDRVLLSSGASFRNGG